MTQFGPIEFTNIKCAFSADRAIRPTQRRGVEGQDALDSDARSMPVCDFGSSLSYREGKS